MPFPGFARQLPAPRGGERVVLGAAIVLGLAPRGGDKTLLFELEERGVQRAKLSVRRFLLVSSMRRQTP